MPSKSRKNKSQGERVSAAPVEDDVADIHAVYDQGYADEETGPLLPPAYPSVGSEVCRYEDGQDQERSGSVAS